MSGSGDAAKPWTHDLYEEIAGAERFVLCLSTHASTTVQFQHMFNFVQCYFTSMCWLFNDAQQ